eukprot:UN25461
MKHKYRKKSQQPQDRFIKVTFDGKTPLRIVWGTGNRHIEWKTVKLIAHGHWTPTFVQKSNQLDKATCFSVVSAHTILDLQNNDKNVVKMWVTGLRHLLNQSDEEANRLSEELKKNPPTTKQPKKHRSRRKQQQEAAPPNKKRTESLILYRKIYLL